MEDKVTGGMAEVTGGIDEGYWREVDDTVLAEGGLGGISNQIDCHNIS